MRTNRLSSCTDPALRPVRVRRPARPPIFLMAGLSLLLVLTGCESKESERSPDDNRASQRAPSAQSQAASRPIDWAKVAEALGKAGAIQPGDVYKVGMPRGDLHVTASGVRIKPALALGSWVGFKQTGENQVIAMGDLVLLESEVASVIMKLQEGGIEQTAIHNHLLHEAPRVIYVHIRGQGDPIKIASAIHSAVTVTGTPLGTAAGKPESFDLDTAKIRQILGRTGMVNGGVYQVSVPRAEAVIEGGMEVPPAMGVATALNFQPTGGKKAAITGDFVLIGGEVNPVIQVLEQNGIEATALHSHMLDESPRLFFMHFWANDDALKLAKGLWAALDKMNVKPAS
jgi:Domain of Unknown Function (DUF1259)